MKILLTKWGMLQAQGDFCTSSGDLLSQRGWGDLIKQACHPGSIEAVCPTTKRSLHRASLLRAFSNCAAKENHRPNQLIGQLLRPLDAELELFPIVGRIDAGA
jgi:hypothetical protein